MNALMQAVEAGRATLVDLGLQTVKIAAGDSGSEMWVSRITLADGTVVYSWTDPVAARDSGSIMHYRLENDLKAYLKATGIEPPLDAA